MKKRALIVPTDSVESRILTIRGQKVILDSDLAEIYGVETSALKSGGQTKLTDSLLISSFSLHAKSLQT